MDFGVHLPQGFPSGENALDFLTRFVRDADTLGYKHLSFGDHFIYTMDGPITLASVIGVSGQMKLVPSVLLPVQRGLFPSAKMLIALDILSGGRLIAGIGPGSMEREYELTGIAFEERWPRFDEIAASLRSLLRPGAPAFNGRFYSTEGVRLFPAPVQQPVPIWIGSWGTDAGLRRVARLADGWLASALESTPESFKDAKDRLAGHLDKQGKDPSTFPNALSTASFYVNADESKLEELKSRLGQFGRWGGAAGGGRWGGGNEGARPAVMAPRADEEHSQPPLVGTPEQVAERLIAFDKAGVQMIYLMPMQEPIEQIHVFMEEVAPLVNGA